MEQQAKISSISFVNNGKTYDLIRFEWIRDLSLFSHNVPCLFMLSSMIDGRSIPVFVGVAEKWQQFKFADENYDRFIEFLKITGNNLYVINQAETYEELKRLKSFLLNENPAFPYLKDFNL
jgi:hypothetical protein